MTEQGGRQGHNQGEGEPRDWWGKLYANDASDTGGSRTGDTVEGHLASAAEVLGAPIAGPDGARDGAYDEGPDRSDSAEDTGGDRAGAYDRAHDSGDDSARQDVHHGPLTAGGGAPEEDPPGPPDGDPDPDGQPAPSEDRPDQRGHTTRATLRLRQVPDEAMPEERPVPEPPAQPPTGPVEQAPAEEPHGDPGPDPGPDTGADPDGDPHDPDAPLPGESPRTRVLATVRRPTAPHSGSSEASSPPPPTAPTAAPESGGGAAAPFAGASLGDPSGLDLAPLADPHALYALVPHTVLDGARSGTSVVRTASVRGRTADEAQQPRQDAVFTARFGEGESGLLLAVVAGASPHSCLDPRLVGLPMEACANLAAAIGRSHERLTQDLRASRNGALKSGLHRLTNRCYARLRARTSELAGPHVPLPSGLRALLLPADPECHNRIYFGFGDGGLFRLRAGAWRDIEPSLQDAASVDDGRARGPADPRGAVTGEVSLAPDAGTSGPGHTSPGLPVREPGPTEPFRFRASIARQGDTLLLCGPGFAEPLRADRDFASDLAGRWADVPRAPRLPKFLDDVLTPVEGHPGDRTVAVVWELPVE
ncbi:hypothetical protein [Streptomyces sp. NPDC005438]|uniref:hypothetical protein n=1 Tax=Streptomyces sp. NPDC005438 TaxID=3156880 RepID=UPI0033A4B8E6